MNCVTCLKIGDRYSSIYVNKLYNAVRKQCDLDFICFTDDPSGIDPNVIVYDIQPLVKDPSKWQDPKRERIGLLSWWPAWSKLELFGREELDKYEKKIFFDLDVVIQGDLSPILDYETNLAVTHSTWKSEEWVKKNQGKREAFAFNSDCIVWKDVKFIYEQYISDWKRHCRRIGADDVYLNEYHLSDLEFLPEVFYSYNKGSKPEHYYDGDGTPYLKFMPEYSVCTFHGKPDIHDLGDDHVLYKIWNDS